MVENSRDPNMSTKIQELSRQVSFITVISQECYLLKCIWFSKVPDSASPFQDWSRMSSQSKQVVHLLVYFLHYRWCFMNYYHLGAHSTSSSATSGAKHPPARNWSSIQDSSLLHRLFEPSQGFLINRISSQSMASSCPQPFSALKVLEDSKRPRWCSASPVIKPLISPQTGISALVASWNTLSR